ncbi:MAG: leucine/isoleucine/valine transporter permease subunit [Chloroflexota bacterium]
MQKQSSIWLASVRNGLIGGAVSLLLCLVGMVMQFGERFVVSGVITMGQVLVVAPVLVFGYTIARRLGLPPVRSLLAGALSGLCSGVILAALVGIGQVLNLREMFVNASPELYALLTFGLSLGAGIPALLAFAGLMGALGATLALLPSRPRGALIQAMVWVILIGLLRDLISTVIQTWGPVAALVQWMFALSGLTVPGAILLLILVGGWTYWRYADAEKRAAKSKRSARQLKWIRWGTWLLIALVVMVLPRVLGVFLSDVADTVGLFILMGLGLNIVVGFAGLLDLGYVAFFAIGAYMMGVLTSPELNANPLTYWEALPIALIAVVGSGFILGLPVLKMRGDYLAIVTLGFGEIVRLLVLSDWLRPWLGGTQGIQLIAHPVIGPLDFGSQQTLYYVIVAFILVAMFIAMRLKDSHLGRSWMALREDEDVAKAMGIDHVVTKLLAFASGAFFAGLGGTLFAAKLSSTYPQSFQFLVSINVLSLIIIGGMGSIPGVLVGAFALVGLPELLREFAEYRYLVYGAVLVAMMLTKPEGLIPEARRGLELHEAEEEGDLGAEPEPASSRPGGRR